MRDRKNIFKLALSREKLLISQGGSDSLRVGFQEMVTGPDRSKRLAGARSTKSLLTLALSFLISSARYPALKVMRGTTSRWFDPLGNTLSAIYRV